MNDEEKKAVADWEEESGGIVYAAILSNMVFGRCLALLYVSAEDEEWELDREDLKEEFHLRMWQIWTLGLFRTWKHWNCTCKWRLSKNRVGGGVMLEYNEQTENLMEIAMMLEQLKGESEYLFEVLTDIDSITWKQKFVDWANEFTETYEPNKDVWPGNYLK